MASNLPYSHPYPPIQVQPRCLPREFGACPQENWDFGCSMSYCGFCWHDCKLNNPVFMTFFEKSTEFMVIDLEKNISFPAEPLLGGLGASPTEHWDFLVLYDSIWSHSAAMTVNSTIQFFMNFLREKILSSWSSIWKKYSRCIARGFGTCFPIKLWFLGAVW